MHFLRFLLGFAASMAGSLHLLPVGFGIEFKVLLVTFKRSGSGPRLESRNINPTLSQLAASGPAGLLAAPKSRFGSKGDSAFAFRGPRLLIYPLKR